MAGVLAARSSFARATWALWVTRKRIFLHQDENCKFPVFLRSLDGRTKSTPQVHESEKVSQVKQRISVSMRVPGDCFYLTLNSRLLDEDALIVESGISRDMQISACGRLRQWNNLWRVGLLVLQKREALGLPSLSVSGVVSQDETFPLVWVFAPNGYKGNFREQRHMGRKPTPQTVGDPSMRGPVVWACSICYGAKKASCQAEQS